MKQYMIIGILFAGLCLAAFLITPVAAAPKDNVPVGGNYAKVGAINENLKEDLWTIYADTRLQVFDLHVEEGQSISSTLEAYEYDTSALDDILGDMPAMRTELSTALDSHDQKAIQSVNKDIRTSWKDFFKGMRRLLRGDTGIPAPE